jgi:hypothetical protein
MAAALLLSSVPTEADEGGSPTMWSVTIQPSSTVTAAFRAESPQPGQTGVLAWEGNKRHRGLLLDMIDLRGVPTGWSVLISTDAQQGLSLQPGAIRTWAGNGDLARMQTFALEPATPVPALAWMAGPDHGDGLYTLEFDAAWPFGPDPTGARPITLILDLQGDAP